MKKELMLDLETLSTQPNAAIMSIGVVMMDMDNLKIVAQKQWNVMPETCQEVGLHIDATTVKWWIGQDIKAKTGLYIPQPIPLAVAVQELFAEFYANDSYPTWGNGAGFDNVILRSACEAVKVPCPFVFYHDRCYRTMKNMFPQVTVLRQPGTEHIALDDAIYQAEHLFAIMRHIRGKNEPVHQDRLQLQSN